MPKTAKPTFDHAEFHKETAEYLSEFGDYMAKRIKAVYDGLTDDERARFATRDMNGTPEQFPRRLVRIILLAIADEVADDYANAEEIKSEPAKVRRILKNRYS